MQSMHSQWIHFGHFLSLSLTCTYVKSAYSCNHSLYLSLFRTSVFNYFTCAFLKKILTLLSDTTHYSQDALLQWPFTTRVSEPTVCAPLFNLNKSKNTENWRRNTRFCWDWLQNDMCVAPLSNYWVFWEAVCLCRRRRSFSPKSNVRKPRLWQDYMALVNVLSVVLKWTAATQVHPTG